MGKSSLSPFSVFSATLLGLCVRAVHLAAIARSAIPDWQRFTRQTDFSVTWSWAAEIRAGNWLGQPPFHPDTWWMRGLGTPADWERWWGGLNTFQQAPLYPYLVAVLCAPTHGSPVRLFILQSVLGAACVPMVAFLARRWGGASAGVLAAFLWALARTEVALDSFLLRDALAMPLFLGGLCLLERLRTHASAGGPAFGVGVLLGLATLQRENVLLLGLFAAPLAASLLARDARAPLPSRAGRARVAGWVLLGFGLTLAPLVARNVHLGVAPLALSNRAPEAIFAGLSLAPGADPVGIHFYSGMRQELEAARGSVFRSYWIVLEGGLRTPAAFAQLLLRKAWGWLSAGEPPDNVDLDYLVLRSPILRLCIPTGLLMGPALLGLALCARHRRQCAVGLWAFFWMLPPLFTGLVLWRLRSGLLPLLIPFTAVALSWLFEQGRSRRASFVIATVALVAFTGVAYRFPAAPLFQLGPMGASLSAAAYLARGEPAAALTELDEYLAFVARGDAKPFPAITELREEILRGPQRSQ